MPRRADPTPGGPVIPGTRLPAGESAVLDALVRGEARIKALGLVALCSNRFSGGGVEALILAQENLLRDLSLPASMDAAARRLAGLAGLSLPVGSIAPGWARHHYDGDFSGYFSEGWMLFLPGDHRGAGILFTSTNWPNPAPSVHRQVIVRGIGDTREPISAMIAASVAW